MSNLTQLPLDVRKEFSIDSDGKAYVTASGLARLTGISRRALCTRLLENIKGNKNLPECLKPFAGMNFKGEQNQEFVIPDIVASAIIEYYAFESKVRKEQAVSVYRAFASIGFRAWIQQELGYKQADDTNDKFDALMQVLKSQHEDTQKRLGDLEKEVAKLTTYRNIYPNYDDIIDNTPLKALSSSSYYTLSEWLDKYHPDYPKTRRFKCRFSRKVSEAYSVNVGTKPVKVERANDYKSQRGVHRQLINGYKPEHFGLLETAYRESLKN